MSRVDITIGYARNWHHPLGVVESRLDDSLQANADPEIVEAGCKLEIRLHGLAPWHVSSVANLLARAQQLEAVR